MCPPTPVTQATLAIINPQGFIEGSEGLNCNTCGLPHHCSAETVTFFKCIPGLHELFFRQMRVEITRLWIPKCWKNPQDGEDRETDRQTWRPPVEGDTVHPLRALPKPPRISLSPVCPFACFSFVLIGEKKNVHFSLLWLKSCFFSNLQEYRLYKFPLSLLIQPYFLD